MSDSNSDSSTTGTIVTQVLGVATAIIGSLLAAHAARLKGARNENQAIPQVVQATDATIQAIVDKWQRGEVSTDDALQALYTVDAANLSYLQGQVGAPGTAWSAAPSRCDKSCTVGCCVYTFDLRPAIDAVASAMRAGGGSAMIPKVWPGKYSAFTRPSYTLNLVAPNPAQSVIGRIENLLHGGSGLPGTQTTGGNRMLYYGIAALAGLVIFAKLVLPR